MPLTKSGDAEQGRESEEPALHHHTGYGGQYHGAEHARAPAADNFFNHEQNGGDGRVKSGRQAGRRADGRDQANTFARQM